MRVCGVVTGAAAARALELQTNPITEKAHTWTFSWFKGTSFLVLPHVRLLIKNWRLRDFFSCLFLVAGGHMRGSVDKDTVSWQCASLHLSQSAAPLAQFSPTAVASHCSWMPRPHTAHSPMPHWHSYSFCKEEENINREAEGGVEELQYLKHVVFSALL